jgi:hypothetical protein
MTRRYIDPRAAHAALDRLLELYQGSPQGFLADEPIEPASGLERDSLLKDAEKAFLDLLAPALPSHEPPELDIHSHAGRYLREKHGIDVTAKTLKNRASAGLEPRPKYIGRTPYHEPPDLDRYVEGALSPTPAGS